MAKKNVDNVRTTYNFLRNKGLSPAQASGIIGVMQGESGQGLSTTALNHDSGAYGIAQWLAGRKSRLLSRPNPNSIHTQLNHLWDELQTSEIKAFRQIKGAHSIDSAVNAWLFGFERPGPNEANLAARTQNARNVFNALNKTGSSGPSGKNIASAASVSDPGSSDSGVPASSVTIGGGTRTQFQTDPAMTLLSNLIAKRNPNSLLLKLGVISGTTANQVSKPGTTINFPAIPGSDSRPITGGSSRASGASAGGVSLSGIKSKSPLFELIHNTGQNGPGYAVKNGQKVDGRVVYSDVWAGHKDHVHVAAGPKTVVAIGKLAQGMGLHVGENPHFGGVTAVHTAKSYHYRGEAIDVGGDPHRMNQFAHRVERLYGIH